MINKTDKITGKSIREYLKEGKRFDGRGLDEFRKIDIETDFIKNAEGSARVRLGKTEVVAGIKLGIAVPYPDSPNMGNLMTTVELLPLSSSRFKLGPPPFSSIEIGRIIDRAVRESKIIELKKLVIKEGEIVWNVFIDIYSINDDGNLLDAMGIAAVAALKNTKIPKYEEETKRIIYETSDEKKLPLSEEIPVSITLHKIGDKFIVDPTREEEDLSETRVTIGSHQGIIHSLQKGEMGKIKIEEFNKIIDNLIKIEEKIYKVL